MRTDLQVLVGGALTFCVPVGLAIRELLRRRPSGERPDPGPVPPRPAPKPLPDCLIPELGRRVRELEDA